MPGAPGWRAEHLSAPRWQVRTVVLQSLSLIEVDDTVLGSLK